MTMFLETAASFILVLGVLVFVHELGHFAIAKAFGIEVPVFSLGFGPRLAGFRRRETDYRISLIPLGGYVRLLGDEADEHRTGDPREFLSRPRWQRFLVFVAGATFNVLLALLVTWLGLWAYGKYEVKSPESHPVIVAFEERSTAEAAGLRAGDAVISVGGRDAREPETFRDEILLSPGTVKAVVVEREGRRLTFQVDTGADPRYRLGDPGWSIFTEPPVLVEVMPGSPAESAGLRPGDRVLAVEDREPVSDMEFREVLAKSAGQEVRIKVRRGEGIVTVTVVPRSENGRGVIGVLPRPGDIVHRDLTLLAAAAESCRVNLELAQTVFLTLRRMVRGDIPVRALSGPIEIARVSRQAVRGMESFLGFLAFISLQLGILNLLPIPVLDGGHILILGVEGALRRDLSMKVKERVMQAGLLFLIAFFGVVIYFDVIKTFFTS